MQEHYLVEVSIARGIPSGQCQYEWKIFDQAEKRRMSNDLLGMFVDGTLSIRHAEFSHK
jgi:hypothetical protein